MKFFVYCVDRPGQAELRRAKMVEHWDFIAGYEDRLIARGPTLSEDGGGLAGSVHILELADREAAKSFAYDEPFAEAGLYDRIVIKRWRAGRAGEYRERRDAPKFLVHAIGRPGMTEKRDRLLDAHRKYFDAGYRHAFIARGPTLSEDGESWTGSAMLVELPDRAALDQMLASEPYTRAGLYESVEIRPWRIGGRR